MKRYYRLFMKTMFMIDVEKKSAHQRHRFGQILVHEASNLPKWSIFRKNSDLPDVESENFFSRKVINSSRLENVIIDFS